MDEQNGINILKVLLSQKNEITALKTMLKKYEFSAPGGVCPNCGGPGYHDLACRWAALIYPEFTESYKRQTGTTAIETLLIDDFLGNLEEPPTKKNKDDYFPCPKCNQGMDHYRNVGRDHYGVCLDCGVFFLIGTNLFSGWQDEAEPLWEENKIYLAQLQYLNPVDNIPGDAPFEIAF